MLSSIAVGTCSVKGFSSSVDCYSTLDCIRRLGIPVEVSPSLITIHGKGLSGYSPLETPVQLDAGNSGSTIRMISGILAGNLFQTIIDGDESLRKRPMGRIIDPLRSMGATIEARDGRFSPLKITGGNLQSITFESRVASAQVKTCILFAGLFARGRTNYIEPVQTRDHTERMLQQFGAQFESTKVGQGWKHSIDGRNELKPVEYRVPSDVSSAAFFVAAAAAVPGSRIELDNINLNPSRTAFLDLLKELGASIESLTTSNGPGEPVGTIRVEYAGLSTGPNGLRIGGEWIPNLIDELPLLGVVATQVAGRLEVRDASELRVKESDRIRTTVDGIRALGGKIEELEDGFIVEGPQQLSGGRISSEGDHRIAMAFSVAGLLSDRATEIEGAEAASVSLPEFYELLGSATIEGTVQQLD